MEDLNQTARWKDSQAISMMLPQVGLYEDWRLVSGCWMFLILAGMASSYTTDTFDKGKTNDVHKDGRQNNWHYLYFLLQWQTGAMEEHNTAPSDGENGN